MIERASITTVAHDDANPPATDATGRPRAELWVIWIFLVHVLVGTALFAVIYAPAIGMNLLVKELIRLNISRALVVILQISEYALVGIGTIMYLVFLVRVAVRHMKEL